jgi:hypothetical protein
MYYLRINEADPNKLDYYCRKCGNEDILTEHSNICISKINIKKGNSSFSHIVNEYTKLDPTLPRINTILCPNAECETNTASKKREIIYIRYDDVNMKYVYMCSECSVIWKTTNV